jgi:hypothetical protein
LTPRPGGRSSPSSPNSSPRSLCATRPHS